MFSKETGMSFRIIKNTVFIWCLLLPVIGLSQSETARVKPELIPVFKNGKWGAVDTNLRLTIPYQYAELQVVKENFLVVKTNNQYQLIDKNQQPVLSSGYNEIKDAVGNYVLIRKKEYWGIATINRSEELDCKFNQISILNDKVAVFKSEKALFFYLFDSKKISAPYDSISLINNQLILLKRGRQQFLYNYNNQNYTLPFITIEQKSENLFFCTDSTDTKYLLRCNKSFEYRKTNSFFIQNLGELMAYSVNDSMVIVGENYTTVARIKADAITVFAGSKNGYTMSSFVPQSLYYQYSYSGKSGILDASFKQIIPARYDEIFYVDTAFIVVNNGKKGLINLDGKVLVPPNYQRFNKSGDYWLVEQDNNWGVISNSGRQLIPPEYDNLQLIFGNRFIATRKRKRSMLDALGRVLIPPEYDIISASGNCCILKMDTLYGLAGKTGEILISPRYKLILELNENYFKFRENRKTGVINSQGKIIVKPEFRDLFSSRNSNIFFVQSYQYENISANTIKNKYHLDIRIPRDDRPINRHKIGVINTFGQMLLDTTCFQEQITDDFLGNTLIVKDSSSVLVVTFENDGRLIDKISYKNYIFVKPGKELPLKNYWATGTGNKSLLFGLFTPSGGTLLNHRFIEISRNFLKDTDLVLVTNDNHQIGVVNERTGKYLIDDIFRKFYADDFKKAKVARFVTGSGRALLIDSSANIVMKGIGFMDGFSQPFIRVNKGGKLIYANDAAHKLFLNKENNIIPSKKKDQKEHDLICKGGKWGVIDTTGSWVIEPSYQFLQSYKNDVFIARNNDLWGVINTENQVIIDFIYDEVSYFYDDTEKHWASIPFFKVRKDNKWGVVDKSGKLIIDIFYDDVELLKWKGTIYFKTLVDLKTVKYGLVNQLGKLVLKPTYEYVDQFENGFARVRRSCNCWTFINKQLNEITHDCFIHANAFKEGRAAVKSRSGWGFIDENGSQIISCQYIDAGDYNEGLAKVKIIMPAKLLGLVKRKRAYNLIDKNGNTCFNTKAKYCSDVKNGQIVIRKGKKFQVVTTKGKKVLPAGYNQVIGYQDNGLYIVKIKNKGFAAYNNRGQLVVPFGKYREYADFSEGLCYVSGNQSGYIDTLGQMKIEMECREARDFHDGFAAIKTKDGWGFIDSEGNFVIEPQYYSAWDFQDGIAKVMDRDFKTIYLNKEAKQFENEPYFGEYQLYSLNGLKGIRDAGGAFVVYPAAEEIGLFNEGFAPVGIQKQYGLYNSEGKQLAAPEYMGISMNEDGFVRLFNLEEVRYLRWD